MIKESRTTTCTRYVAAERPDWVLRNLKNAVCDAIIRNVPVGCIPEGLHGDIENVGEYHLSLLTNQAFEDSFTYTACTLYLTRYMLSARFNDDDEPWSHVVVVEIVDLGGCEFEDCDSKHFDIRVSVSVRSWTL